jgi:hypothetical protein
VRKARVQSCAADARRIGAFSIQAHAPESTKMLYLHWIGAFYRFHQTIKRSGDKALGIKL